MSFLWVLLKGCMSTWSPASAASGCLTGQASAVLLLGQFSGGGGGGWELRLTKYGGIMVLFRAGSL